MSFLPGLTENAESQDVFIDANEIHKLVIPQGSQWKIKVPTESKLTIKIISGIGEIFGTELANDVEYIFQNWSFTIQAIEEVHLEWKGPDNHPIVEGEDIILNSTAKFIYNLHFALEKMRNSTFDGPKLMIIGSKNSGKTSLCRTLCSYTIKFKTYQPLFVNTNPQEGIFSPPGCLTATPISDILDVQLPIWGQSMTSGANALHSKQPLIKNFGLETITENNDYYLSILDQLADDVGERLQRDALVQRSGCIIDTPPLSQLSDDLTELKVAIQKLKVNIIVMLANDDTGEEKEYFEKISKELKPYVGDFFLRVPKLSGVINVDDVYQRSVQRYAIKEYFYGNQHSSLSPFSVSVDYEDLAVFRPKTILDAQEPGTESSKLALLPVEINPSNLQHALVAITYAEKRANRKEVQESAILGFALINEVNEKRRKVRILVPVPGNFPNNALILTSFRYLE